MELERPPYRPSGLDALVDLVARVPLWPPLAYALKDVLAGLETARAAVARASTWPWEAEAPRLLVSALLLPLVAWAVQQVAERWFR